MEKVKIEKVAMVMLVKNVEETVEFYKKLNF